MSVLMNVQLGVFRDQYSRKSVVMIETESILTAPKLNTFGRILFCLDQDETLCNYFPEIA